MRTGVRLTYALPGGGTANLRILDVTGRTVRAVELGPPSPGVHILEWDLADAAGRPVPPGFYFVRLSRDREARTVRVSVVR